MIQEPKLTNATVDEYNSVFQKIFLLVGLREKDFPNQLETLFLFEYLKQNYSSHSLSEILLAFEKAVKGELDIEHKDVVPYDNFSTLYLAGIINAYRKWSGLQHRVLEKYLPPVDDKKYLQPPVPPETPWGKFIEQEYQHFLSFGDEHWKMFPNDFYNQLVKDDLLNELIYRQAMPIVRKRLIGSLLRDKMKHQMASTRSHDKNRVEFVKSIQQTNISEIDKKIKQYETGEKDSEIEVVAKQFCVLQYFKKAKHEGRNNIYQPAIENT